MSINGNTFAVLWAIYHFYLDKLKHSLRPECFKKVHKSILTSLLLIVEPNCFALRCLLRHQICSTDFWCMHGEPSLSFSLKTHPFYQKKTGENTEKENNCCHNYSYLDSAAAAALWPERELGHSGLKGRPPEPPFLQGLHPCTLLVDSWVLQKGTLIYFYLVKIKKKLTKYFYLKISVRTRAAIWTI